MTGSAGLPNSPPPTLLLVEDPNSPAPADTTVDWEEPNKEDPEEPEEDPNNPCPEVFDDPNVEEDAGDDPKTFVGCELLEPNTLAEVVAAGAAPKGDEVVEAGAPKAEGELEAGAPKGEDDAAAGADPKGEEAAGVELKGELVLELPKTEVEACPGCCEPNTEEEDDG